MSVETDLDYRRMWHMVKDVIREHMNDPEIANGIDSNDRIRGYALGLRSTLEMMAALEEVAPRGPAGRSEDADPA